MATIDAGQVIPSIGTVSKVAAGGTPTATLTISEGVPKINFGLVTGDKGATGASVTAASIDQTGHLIITVG